MDSVQFANTAAKYLNRCTLTPAERREFDELESVFRGLAMGELVIGKPEKTENTPVDKGKKK